MLQAYHAGIEEMKTLINNQENFKKKLDELNMN